ncbi:MAG: hypothetical protein AAFX04_12900 [Pseudomonadota bacterium]
MPVLRSVDMDAALVGPGLQYGVKAMIPADNLVIIYASISFAATALAAVLATRDWRFRMAVDGFFAEDDAQLSPKLARLKEVQRMTEIADAAIAARQRRVERIAPDSFGRSHKKTPVIDRR